MRINRGSRRSIPALYLSCIRGPLPQGCPQSDPRPGPAGRAGSSSGRRAWCGLLGIRWAEHGYRLRRLVMLLRRVARPLLASMFIQEGLDALRAPAPHVITAREPAQRASRALGLRRPLTDRDLTMVVRAHGGLTVAAGLGLALGKAPRSCSLVLAALSVPLAIAHQPFTKGTGPRAERTKSFVQALGSVGAALLAAADKQGKPGFAWRVERARAERAHVRRAVARASD